MATREPGYDDNSIAKKFFSGGPPDTRPQPNTEVRRSTPAHGVERGGASPKHHISHGHGQDRTPARNVQGAESPTHAGARRER